ncbi:MAG: VOC family protein [Actinobacteria bacterium]|nr:VOC family protein [Actinomycetota bacterium]
MRDELERRQPTRLLPGRLPDASGDAEPRLSALAGIHHVGLRVADLDEAAERWSRQFGLTIGERHADRAYLRCGFEDYSLELIASDSPGFDHAGWELGPGRSFADLGVDGELIERPDGRAPSLLLADPDGFGVEIVEWTPRESEFPDVARLSGDLPGLHPRRLGHVNVLSEDVQRLSRFYVDDLGFRVTDYLGDEGIWLHLNADHHVHAMVQKSPTHFHHFALELADIGEMRVALDHLAKHGRWVVWGPGRHGVAASLFAYIRIPEDDLIVELYADMEQLRLDHKPRDWEDTPHSSNVWGTLPPRTYFRFDEEAIEIERGQLQALGRLPD